MGAPLAKCEGIMNTEYLTELNRVPLKSDDNAVVVYRDNGVSSCDFYFWCIQDSDGKVIFDSCEHGFGDWGFYEHQFDCISEALVFVQSWDYDILVSGEVLDFAVC